MLRTPADAVKAESKASTFSLDGHQKAGVRHAGCDAPTGPEVDYADRLDRRASQAGIT